MQFNWRDALRKIWVGLSSQMLRVNWGVMLKNFIGGFFRGLREIVSGVARDLFET